MRCILSCLTTFNEISKAYPIQKMHQNARRVCFWTIHYHFLLAYDGS